MKMVGELRTDSSSYRVELLSPTPDGETVIGPNERPWRLNLDEFQLPEPRMNPRLGIGRLFRTVSKLSIFFLLIIIICLETYINKSICLGVV